MPTIVKEKKVCESKPDLSEPVIKAVLEQLGTPPSMLKTTATNIFDNCYRVNVYCGTFPEARISDSLVVRFDGDKLVGDEIRRKYGKRDS